MCEFRSRGETEMEEDVGNFYSTCKVKKEWFLIHIFNVPSF